MILTEDDVREVIDVDLRAWMTRDAAARRNQSDRCSSHHRLTDTDCIPRPDIHPRSP